MQYQWNKYLSKLNTIKELLNPCGKLQHWAYQTHPPNWYEQGLSTKLLFIIVSCSTLRPVARETPVREDCSVSSKLNTALDALKSLRNMSLNTQVNGPYPALIFCNNMITKINAFHLFNISSLQVLFKISLLLSLLSDSLGLLPKQSYPSSCWYPCGASKDFPPKNVPAGCGIWDPLPTSLRIGIYSLPNTQ